MARASIGIIAQAVFETLGISVPAIWHAQRGQLTREMCDAKLRSWSGKLLAQAGITLRVSGQEHLAVHPPPYVVISNHQSLYDIPVLFQALPFSLTMAAKKELFSVPVWGKAMSVAGFVSIDRANSDKAYEALKVAGQKMTQDKLSLMIAPEGTRSTTGELLPFRNGAFNVSKITGHPILPVVIDGTLKVHKSGELVVHRGEQVDVRIGAPLFPADYPSIEEYREAGRREIQSRLDAAAAEG